MCDTLPSRGEFFQMSSFVHNSDDTTGPRPRGSDLDMRHDSNVLVYKEAEDLLAAFPNDLARLIYLASLRDYNTGLYLHPNLSRRFPSDLVDCGLRLHHERVFGNLLEASVRDYLDQLRLYIAFAGVSRAELINTWRDLEAYKSAVPLHYNKTCAEVFSLNILSALCILDRIG